MIKKGYWHDDGSAVESVDGPAVYFGHHKCASSWLNRILWNCTADLGLRFESFSSDEGFGGDLSGAVASRQLDVLSLRNARWEHIEMVSPRVGLHVIRDPRDIVVSAYFSHLKTHKLLTQELCEARERLQRLSKEEGLVAEMDGISGQCLSEMSEWRAGEAPQVLEYKMEELTVKWETELPKIFKHFGWLPETSNGDRDPCGARFWSLVNQAYRRSRGYSLLRKRREQMSVGGLDRILERLSFRNLSGGRKTGQIDETSHYRTGKAGDWKNHFSPEVSTAFKDRFPGLVTQLGYAENDDW